MSLSDLNAKHRKPYNERREAALPFHVAKHKKVK